MSRWFDWAVGLLYLGRVGFLSKLGLSVPAEPARADVGPFVVGRRYSEGHVQRHILRLHRDFADSWRICGDFLCVSVPADAIEGSSYSVDDDTVSEYAQMIRCGSLPPAIVLDYDGDFIDGGHRHAAAILAGSNEILALVQISDIQEDSFTDDD